VASSRFCVFLVVLTALSVPTQAQEGAYGVVYRPDSVAYRGGESAHFDYVYQTGSEDMARRTARALEDSWPGTDSLVGPREEMDMPVVINDFNDRSNGFVNPLPFRQEIEAPSIRSAPLVTRAPSWPAIVAPHEAVHAAHAEVDGTVGVGSVIRPFAPDLARSLNLLAPRGLIEGVAVYRESRLDGRTGRLNAPRFRMKMEAAMLSEDPWGLTEMLEPPAYTQPFNRFYIGGGHAFEYLAERGDSTDTNFFDTAVTWHNRLPFVGHGVWLGIGLGQFPHQVGNEVQSSLSARYRENLDERAPFTSTTVVAGETGRNHRRPYWLDNETLLAYVHGYDVRPGFYRIDAATGARSTVRVQELTEDRVYSLGPDTTALYAGRYVQAPLVPRQEIAEVERVDLSTGTATRLTDGARAFAPAPAPGERVYAITNDGPFTRWSRVEQGQTAALTAAAPRSIRQIAPAPDDSTIAVLVNEDGRQRVYRAREPVERPAELDPWFGVDDAVVYDLSWGPEGRYLLFSADINGPPNAFAFDTQTREVLRLTSVRFGALEPTLSPDRSTLAFVNYQHERHDLVRTPFRPDSVSTVPDSLIHRGGWTTPAADRSSRDSTGTFSPGGSYAAWKHLAPRMVYPTVHGGDDSESVPSRQNPGGDPLGLGLGLGIQGADPLQRWAYRGNAYWQDGRFWGEAHLQTGTLLFRPSMSLYDRAFTTLVRDNNQRVQVKVEERGADLGVRLPVALESNVYQTQFRAGLDAEIRQTRLFGSALPRPTSFATRATLEPRAVFEYRLQQNPRDVVPNTGTVVGAQAEIDAWTEGTLPSSRGLVASIDTYLPVLRDVHTGIRLGARALLQNRGSIFNTETFVPRGYSSVERLRSGPFVALEAEVTQPLWYIDDGLTLLPLYAKALSVYGFGETLGRVDSGEWQRALSSIGGGVSLSVRVFYGFNLDLRVGAAYRPEQGDVVGVYR